MSEQFKQDPGTRNQEIDDDPLAELARIVSGEPELQPASQPEIDVDANELVETPNIAPEEAVSTENEIEAALEEQLMQEFNDPSPENVEIEQPAFIEEINASVGEMVAEPEQVTQAENPVVEQVAEYPADSDSMFQDDLITALEGELAGENDPEDISQNLVEKQVIEEVEHATVQDQAMFEQPNPVERFEAEALNIQDALEQELSGQLETSVEAPVEQASVVEETLVEQSSVTTSMEDDLGAAFATEFEQISAQSPAVVETGTLASAVEQVSDANDQSTVVASDHVPEMNFEEAFASQLDQVSDSSQDAGEIQQPISDNAPSDPDLEMDFEAAFSQELEVASVSAGQNIQPELETVSPGPDAAVAVSPQMPSDELAQMEPNLETMEYDPVEYDPGHVGSVDDISQVDEPLVVANDNGGGKKYAVAALVIALFAGTIAAGYGFLGGDDNTVASGTPEVIKAENDPVKVKPENPGGIVPENQDNASYVDLGGTDTAKVQQDQLDSRTEEPLILNTGPSEPLETAAASDTIKSNDRLTPSEDQGATPNAPGSSVLPKVVQTVVVKPDGTIVQQPSVPKPVETAANTITSSPEVAPKPVETQIITKPEAIDGAQSTGNVQVPTASPLPKPVVEQKPATPAQQVAAAPRSATPAPAPAARRSEWVVQVSSQRSPEAAQQSFNTMRNRYDVLKGRAMSIQRANVNGDTYFRVRVQTSSRADATQLCSSLAAAGGSCFVTR